MRVDGSERNGQRNRLCLKRLEPEVARHHHVRKNVRSEFESLPPSQTRNWLVLHDFC